MTDIPDNTRAAQDCASMAELRVEIDAIDRHLIAVLTHRAGYIDRAIPLKQVEDLPARTVDRVADVIAKVRAEAEAQGLDPELAETLWSELIEWSIRREQRVLG